MMQNQTQRNAPNRYLANICCISSKFIIPAAVDTEQSAVLFVMCPWTRRSLESESIFNEFCLQMILEGLNQRVL